MTVLVDTNVLLDVFAQRQPYYAASAQVLSEIFSGTVQGVCASHCLTTLHYLVRRHAGQPEANTAISTVLNHMDVTGLDRAGWQKVQALAFPDFEDGAVAVTAEQYAAAFIITRNTPDFKGSVVPAISPAEFLNRFITQPPP